MLHYALGASLCTTPYLMGEIMAVSKEMERITITVDKKVKEQLDRYAELYGISTSRLATNMVYVGLEHVDFLSKLGFGHLVRGLESFQELFKKLVSTETMKDSSTK